MRKLLLRLFGLLPKRPQGHPPFAFLDMEGVEYFAWEDFSQMPPARANEVDDVLLQISAGLDSNTLEAIAEAIVDANQVAMTAKDVKERGRAMAKVATLANELKMRPKHIVPEECYYALAAICAVRKDEDPYKFDHTIQAEKMAAFRLAGRAGHAFFTKNGALRSLHRVARISEGELQSLLVSWTLQSARTRAVLAL